MSLGLGLKLFLCMQKMASAHLDDAAEEASLEVEYGKLKCDPSITVADLEKALEAYFKLVGYRNLNEVLEVIKDGKVTWKSAAKAAKVLSLGPKDWICFVFRP